MTYWLLILCDYHESVIWTPYVGEVIAVFYFLFPTLVGKRYQS